MAFAYVVVPSACTSCRSRESQGEGICVGHLAHAHHTFLSNHVARKDILIFVETLAQRFFKSLHLFHKVRPDIVHHAPNGIIVHDETAAKVVLKNLPQLLAFAESVEESRQGTRVHRHARIVDTVGSNTLQLVHNGTNVLYAGTHLQLHGLLDAHAQRVPVLHGTEVIQSVRHGKHLRVSEALADLLNTTVYVTQHQTHL